MRRVLVLMAAVAAALAGTLPAGAAAPAPRFVVTGHPLAAILGELAAGRAEVVNLVPPKASPHTYEPRPSDMDVASRSAGLFYVSHVLDGWAARLPAPQKVAVMPLVPEKERLPNLEHHHGEVEHAAESDDDPHFWTDPLLVKAVLPALAEQLARLDAPGAATYRANAAAFARRLDALHAQVAAVLAPVKGRAVLLFHPSFQYLTRRHGLVLAGVVEPFPGKEPSPRQLQGIVRTIRAKQVRAVFSEPQLPRRPADVVAEAAGVEVFLLDPIGGVPGRMTYSELVLYNAGVLAEALR